MVDHKIIVCCEAQGKGRARGGPRKVTQRSFIDGGWAIFFYKQSYGKHN